MFIVSYEKHQHSTKKYKKIATILRGYFLIDYQPSSFIVTLNF